ncbi:unnamed protein product [Hermetia illucens]|uniref:Uncharacterized protein n=1 Tax=Hermetia illucens TaxID=343691 RepID=A0A7R8V416_HERIL|nr:unnamed protein product [Hermetia illucens]
MGISLRHFVNLISYSLAESNDDRGHLLDDSRLDHHPGVQSSQMAIYGATGALRSGSSSSSSPGGGHGHPGAAAAAALLVVPQPINATKITAGLTNGTGTGRKYQCKMCPQNIIILNINPLYK